MGWPHNDNNSLGMLYLSTAVVSQLSAHTSRQGRQFTAQNYLAAPVQNPVLQDLAQSALFSCAISCLQGQEVEAAGALPAAACLVLVSAGAQEYVGAVI